MVYAQMYVRGALYLMGLASLAAAASETTVSATRGLLEATIRDMLPKNPNVALLEFHGVSDWFVKSLFVTIAYLGMYVGPAALFELTNPKIKSEKRRESIMRELNLGISAMVVNVVFAISFLWLVDPHLPYFGWYATHEYGVWEFVRDGAVYMITFDGWFYLTHRLLHVPWFFKNVHAIHHDFVNPTAFAQDGVHWFEGLIQGPVGHVMVLFFWPQHPIAHSVMGFLTSIYAIAAHDGRVFDVSDHCAHHHHKEVNFALYGCFDYLLGTKYDRKRNATVRGLALDDVLQYQDVYTQKDLAEALKKLEKEKPAVIAGFRDEVAKSGSTNPDKSD